MIDNLVQLLNDHKYYGATENIEIAKGLYKLPQTIKEKSEQIKRQKAWLRK
tara:strand:- start:587 stop:739 length:153 start_codon:yes stop_codon:yes gene_type:complete